MTVPDLLGIDTLYLPLSTPSEDYKDISKAMNTFSGLGKVLCHPASCLAQTNF